MKTHTIRTALQDVSAASGALTMAATLLESGRPAEDLRPQIDLLHRALRRLDTLMALDPTATLEKTAPAGRVAPDVAADRVLVEAQLEAAASLPSGPVTVQVTATTDSTPFGRAIAQCIPGSYQALPLGDHYVLDLTKAAGELVLDLHAVAVERDVWD